MSWDVWIDIQHDESMLGPVEYEVRFIVLRVVRNPAKYTALGL